MRNITDPTGGKKRMGKDKTPSGKRGTRKWNYERVNNKRGEKRCKKKGKKNIRISCNSERRRERGEEKSIRIIHNNLGAMEEGKKARNGREEGKRATRERVFRPGFHISFTRRPAPPTATTSTSKRGKMSFLSHVLRTQLYMRPFLTTLLHFFFSFCIFFFFPFRYFPSWRHIVYVLLPRIDMLFFSFASFLISPPNFPFLFFVLFILLFVFPSIFSVHL